ncbi:MAG: quinolinate synthase NadA [Planctomycetes bacterium]|nr:quinolinate synthase NadA [Planctomycetota bacterium]
MSTELRERLSKLKRQRNAIILVHNYQRPEVQDVADFVGDSLGLSQQAAKTKADVILFCGVHFMAETAAILCPDKTVLMPDENAGCPMANMVTVRELREKKKQNPNAVVVCYVNTTAAVKAESDICCTSANAPKVVASVPPDKPVLFIPDKSLGQYCARKVKRDFIFWEGYCPTHHRILAEDILRRKAEAPNAQVVVHPECTSDVIDLADHVASTTGILNYCRQSPHNEFIIGTEMGILHRLAKESPRKHFIHAAKLADCPNMKLNTLEKMVWSLEDMTYRVTVPPGIASKARQAIERMLALS